MRPALRRPAAARTGLLKVPATITLGFWITKVLTTGMGEATSDYLAHAMPVFIAGAIGGIVFIIALALQFAVRRYITWIYWFAVAMVAVFGTMAADGLHYELGIPYLYSASFYLVVLAVILVAWYATERTLSIHSIFTWRREAFYWATVLATFALGTALGDLTAYTFGLGFLGGGILFLAVMALPVIGFLVLKLNDVAMFWFAYIATRPIGASFADLLGRPRAQGGIDLGDGLVSLCAAVVIVGCVAYLTWRERQTAVTPADALAE